MRVAHDAGGQRRLAGLAERGLQVSMGCGDVQCVVSTIRLARVQRPRYLRIGAGLEPGITTLGVHASPRHRADNRNHSMPSNKSDNPELVERANELYWRSEESVNQIADEMDLSKSRLYGLIHPLPAGLSCPDCGEGLVFPNRTAMQKGLLSCPACGYEGDRASFPDEVVAQYSDDHPAPDRGGRRRSKRILWASALFGVAAGLYVAARRRRS